MNTHLLILPLVLLLAACGGNVKPWGEEVDAPTEIDGMRIQDYQDLERQRARYALQMHAELGVLSVDPDVHVEVVKNPLKHPTISVKYSGKPPKGIFQDMNQQLDAYRASRLEGNTIIYDTDLAKMTMIMERFEGGNPYDYRELTAVVPYGYCLDFIDENLGKEKDNYILRKVVCSQNGLGSDY